MTLQGNSSVRPSVGLRPTGWCHWHKGPSGTAVLIEIAERGPTAHQFACAPCREQRGLVPLADVSASQERRTS